MPDAPLGTGAEPPLGLTPSQTVGPFLSLVLPWPDGPEVVPTGTAAGFWIRGRLLDGDGEPVPDGVVETWQAAPDGRFDAPGFRGFGRSATHLVSFSHTGITVNHGLLCDSCHMFSTSYRSHG